MMVQAVWAHLKSVGGVVLLVALKLPAGIGDCSKSALVVLLSEDGSETS